MKSVCLVLFFLIFSAHAQDQYAKFFNGQGTSLLRGATDLLSDQVIRTKLINSAINDYSIVLGKMTGRNWKEIAPSVRDLVKKNGINEGLILPAMSLIDSGHMMGFHALGPHLNPVISQVNPALGGYLQDNMGLPKTKGTIQEGQLNNLEKLTPPNITTPGPFSGRTLGQTIGAKPLFEESVPLLSKTVLSNSNLIEPAIKKYSNVLGALTGAKKEELESELKKIVKSLGVNNGLILPIMQLMDRASAFGFKELGDSLNPIINMLNPDLGCLIADNLNFSVDQVYFNGNYDFTGFISGIGNVEPVEGAFAQALSESDLNPIRQCSMSDKDWECLEGFGRGMVRGAVSGSPLGLQGIVMGTVGGGIKGVFEKCGDMPPAVKMMGVVAGTAISGSAGGIKDLGVQVTVDIIDGVIDRMGKVKSPDKTKEPLPDKSDKPQENSNPDSSQEKKDQTGQKGTKKKWREFNIFKR